MTQLQQRHKQL